jgi:hypothetical protein
MVAVDKYFNRSTVQTDTLSSIKNTQHKTNPRSYRQLHRAEKDALIYLYVRGYWITRFYDEQYPDVLRQLTSRRRSQSKIIDVLAKPVHLSVKDFWQHIDDVVIDHFQYF